MGFSYANIDRFEYCCECAHLTGVIQAEHCPTDSVAITCTGNSKDVLQGIIVERSTCGSFRPQLQENYFHMRDEE